MLMFSAGVYRKGTTLKRAASKESVRSTQPFIPGRLRINRQSSLHIGVPCHAHHPWYLPETTMADASSQKSFMPSLPMLFAMNFALGRYSAGFFMRTRSVVYQTKTTSDVRLQLLKVFRYAIYRTSRSPPAPLRICNLAMGTA